jgi:hypothetical protein
VLFVEAEGKTIQRNLYAHATVKSACGRGGQELAVLRKLIPLNAQIDYRCWIRQGRSAGAAASVD